jgi:hypothetical protein
MSFCYNLHASSRIMIYQLHNNQTYTLGKYILTLWDSELKYRTP